MARKRLFSNHVSDETGNLLALSTDSGTTVWHTMAVAQVWRLRDLCFGLAFWRHLMNSTIRQASAKLFAFCAPTYAADLALEDSTAPSFLEVRHVQVPSFSYNSTEVRFLWGWVRYQRPQGLAVGRELKRGIRVSLEYSLYLIDGKATSNLGRQDQVVFIGRECQLRNAHRHRDFELGLELSDIRLAIFRRLEGLSNRLGSADYKLIGACGSNKAGPGGDAKK